MSIHLVKSVKPLASTYRMLTWLCILPANETTSKWEQRAHIAFLLYLITAGATTFFFSLMYTMQFISISLVDTLAGLLQCIAAIPMVNTMIVAFVWRHQIPAVFAKLLEFYGNYKKEDSFHFLVQTNNTSEWLWTLYLKITIVGFFVVNSISSIASVIICWLFNGHFDVTRAFHPLKLVLPWHQTMLLGYVGEMIFAILVVEAYLIYNGAVLLPFVSICLHHQAFYKMFRHSLRKLNHVDGKRNGKECLCKIIDFHISIKRWFLRTSEMYGPHIMIQLISNMLILALYIFQIDHLISKQFDINLFLFSVISIFTTLSNLFLCCFLGKMSSESYKEMAVALYNCDWHTLPLDLQKYFILMIANAQIPQNYNGYGLISLDLETFCSLIRAVATSFMMFNTLSTE